MKQLRISFVVVVLVCIIGCDKSNNAANHSSLMHDQAVIVKRDVTTGVILDVQIFTADQLTGVMTYTDGPSVRFICFGDLVDDRVEQSQMSGEEVEIDCRDGMIVSVSGNTLIFESAINNDFLVEVEKVLANKKMENIGTDSPNAQP